MSERERWIVYPLLFLALGAALRDKLFDQTWSKRIRCEQLQLVDEGRAGLQQYPVAYMGPREIEGRTTGVLEIGYIKADTLDVTNIVADNYVFRGIPFNPLGRVILPTSPADFLRMLQQSAGAMGAPRPVEPPSAQNREEPAPLDDSGEGANNAPDGRGASAPDAEGAPSASQ